MGVIDKNTGELRSTFDILQDLSKAWEGLTSVEKQELTETVAGKTQRALFTALMQNFSTAVGATEAALNSEGSAAEENAKRMDSLQGKMQQLQSAWQDFARNTIDSDFVKNILSAVTGLLKFANAAGGLVPVLTTLASTLAIFKAGSIAKGIFEMSNKFSEFRKTVSELGGGFQAFQLVLSGVKKAEDATKISTLGLAAASQTLMTALGLIGVVIGVATTAYNLFKNAQDEANEAAIQSSKDAGEIADSKKTEKEAIQEEIEKLEQEKDAYINNSDAKDKTIDNSSFLKSKNEEIKKRQENIDKIDEEIEKADRQRKAAAKSFEVQDVKGAGISRTELGLDGLFDSRLQGTIANINKEIEGLSENTGAYNNKLVELRDAYQKQADEIALVNGNTQLYDKVIRALNEEIDRNTEASGKNKEIASELYDMQKSGIDISDMQLKSGENALEYIQQYYDLTDEQIEQLKEGIDVLNEQAEATENYIDAVGGLTDAQKEMQDSLIYTDEELKNINDDIDNTQSAYATLTSAVEEYNSSGGITMDTLQDLLALDGEYLSALELVDGKLQISSEAQKAHGQAMETDTLALIENAAMQDLMAMAAEGSGSTASAAASKIYGAGEDAKTAGSYASEGAKGFNELAESMAKAGMVDISGVNVDEWANKWAGITEKIKGLTSGAGSGGVTGSRFTGSSGGGKKSSGGSGKKSGSSKSTKEEYKAEIDTLYSYKNALDNAKDAVDRLNDALKDTDNFNEQERILRQLIDATNNQINKTNELKNAQTSQMNDYINQLRAQGFAIDYNASKNELFINNMQHLADFSGDTAKNLEKLIKKIQDLNDDNRSLDSSVRDLTGDVKDYYEQLEEIPEKKLKKFNELMKEFQQGRLDQIQNQIDDIQHEMDNDPRLKQLEEQIEALEKQNDEIDKQKELEEKLLAVEEAKEKLANARKQKTLQVYRAGQGFVWESDIDSIKDAADELKDAQDDLNDKIKQDQIDQLQAEKDALEKSYQDRIDALQAFLDEQNYQIDKANREGIQSFQDLQKELAKFGLDSAEYLGKASDWLNNYNKALSDLNTTVNGILSSSTTATDGLIYSSAVQDRINQALSNMIPDTTMTGLTLSNIDYDKIKGNTDNQSIYINNIELPNVKDVDDFVAALKDLPRMATSQSTSRE